MATLLAPKQLVSFEELLMSQVVQQEALPRLLIEKGIFTNEWAQMGTLLNLSTLQKYFECGKRVPCRAELD